MPAVAWRFNIYGQPVKMTVMQMREYLDFTCRKTLKRTHKVTDWSRPGGSRKHVTDVTCDYWKADDIGQSFAGFPFRDPKRPTRHGCSMWFYTPPSHTNWLRAYRQGKHAASSSEKQTDPLQRLEDAVHRLEERNRMLSEQVEELSSKVDERMEEVEDKVEGIDDSLASARDTSEEMDELKRNLDRAQLRCSNGETFFA
jgi:hypothetical protein